MASRASGTASARGKRLPEIAAARCGHVSSSKPSCRAAVHPKTPAVTFTQAELDTARGVWDSLADHVKDAWDPSQEHDIRELLFEAQVRIEVKASQELAKAWREAGKSLTTWGPPVVQVASSGHCAARAAVTGVGLAAAVGSSW